MRTDRVAMVSAAAAIKHSATPVTSTPPDRRDPMINVTPAMPSASPMAACGFNRSPNTVHPAKATISGMVEAMIEANPASTHCMATKFSQGKAHSGTGKDDHCAPLVAGEVPALTQRLGDCHTDQTRNQEAHRKRPHRRRIGDDHSRRGKGRAPEKGKSSPMKIARRSIRVSNRKERPS